MILLNVVCVLIIILATKYWFSRRRICKLVDNLPGPRAYPFVGNLIGFNSNDTSKKFQNLIKLIEAYGNTVRLWLGPQLYIITSDCGTVEEILSNNKITERDVFLQIIMRPILRGGLITSSGEKWKRNRKTVTSTLQMNVLEKFVQNFDKNSRILADRLGKVADGSTIDPFLRISLCALDIICETSMGTDVNVQVKNDCRFMDDILKSLELFGERTARPILMISCLFGFSKIGEGRANNSTFLHELCEKVIEKKIRELKESGMSRGHGDGGNIPVGNKLSCLDLLIRNSSLSEDELMDEVITLIVAGSETSATLASFVLTLLGEHQDVQDRVFEEQKTVFEDDLHSCVTPENLQRMVYLEQVVKETLRLYPSVPSSNRTLQEDLKLSNGFTFPAGSIVMLLYYCIHHNPEHYPEPERFDPERFSPENCARRKPYTYLPFGGGRRMCVGYKYSVMEVKTILSTLLRRFRVVKTVGGMKAINESLQNNLVLKPTTGFKIQLLPREK